MRRNITDNTVVRQLVDLQDRVAGNAGEVVRTASLSPSAPLYPCVGKHPLESMHKRSTRKSRHEWRLGSTTGGITPSIRTPKASDRRFFGRTLVAA